MKQKDGQVWTGYSNSVLLDIANPQAYEWMRDIIVEVCVWGGGGGGGEVTNSQAYEWMRDIIVEVCVWGGGRH